MGDDYASHLYGDLPAEPSLVKSEKVYTELKCLDDSFLDKKVVVRARVHNTRVKGNLAFVVLRDHFYSVQCVASKNESISK